MESALRAQVEAATDEPAFSNRPIVPPGPHGSGVLAQPPHDPPAAAERPESVRTRRHDGWTPERSRMFLSVLSQCGVVADAARAAGIGASSAYRLRKRADGRPFDLAWQAALRIAYRRLSDELARHAVEG